MSCIDWLREADPTLHDLYAKNPLEPGWAGEVSDAEVVYIARELTRRPGLRRLWQVARFTRRRKAITPAIARRLCRWWAEMPAEAVEVPFSDTVGAKAVATMRKTPRAMQQSSSVS